jgi:putative FmdB family regulatory protein
MPIYDYRCRACDETFDVLVRRQDETVTCPACDAAEPERLLSVFAGMGASSTSSASGADPSRMSQHRHSGGCGCGHAH